MTYERYQNGGPRSAGSALSSSEIQSDVNDIRGEISKTFEAISEKLEPKEVFGKLIETISAEGSLVKGISSAFKRNPIPVAMIAGGVGYLLYSEMRARTPSSERASREPGANAGSPEALSRDGGSSELAARSGEVVRHARETARELGHKASALAGDAAGTARGLLEQGQAIARDRPLVLAGLGIALGAAVAGSAPMTRQEQELVGRPAGEAIDKLVGGARKVAEQAKDAVASAIDEQGSDEGERA